MPDAVQYPMGEKIIIKYFSYKNNATLGINFYIKNVLNSDEKYKGFILQFKTKPILYDTYIYCTLQF